MKIYIVSDNQGYHCLADEQHIVKIFKKKPKAEEFKQNLEMSGHDTYDILTFEVE
jgi:hypothetical protein